MPVQRKIGGHVSAAGGIDKAIERAKAIEANCVQVFSGSPRGWARAPLANLDAKKINSKTKELLVSPIITHSLYLINMASENADLRRKSAEAIAYDLEFNALVNGGGIVVHLGSHQGRGWEAVRERVAEQLQRVLAQAPSGSRLLIENAASQNGKIGGNFEEIRWLISQVNSDKLGWCLDTCHAFAAGYSLHPRDPKTPLRAAEVIGRLGLWSKLGCVHVNDSRDPFGSGRDRHENLGEGTIPSADLKAFLHLKELAELPLILEVPGIKGEGPDVENIHRLQQLAA